MSCLFQTSSIRRCSRRFARKLYAVSVGTTCQQGKLNDATVALPGDGSACEGGRQDQELFWRRFFGDPTLWWDSRQDKKISRSPDFRRKGSGEVLWYNRYKPAWVDERLIPLDIQVGRGTPTAMSRLPEKSDSGRPAGYETGMTAVTISTLCQQGKLTEGVEALEVLAQTNCPISKSQFYTVLKQCVAKKDLVLGRRVHALTVKMGYESDTFLSNHILRMYSCHARLQEAMHVFTQVATPDAFMWSSIISAHVKQGQAKQAIQLYHQMCNSGVKPDGHVFVAALQACAREADLETGQQVHANVLASGVKPDLFVLSCLVDMYAKCGSLKDARRLFDGLGQKDVVTWTALIAGYTQQGMGQEALHVYSAMQGEGIAAPDSVTFVCLLQACASVGSPALEKGRQLHARIVERGLQADLVVGCSLVNMYAKCGSLEDAERLFDRLSQKNVVTWNAMIAGYAQQGMVLEALHLYSAMLEGGIAAPDSVTFVCLLQACALVGNLALEKGKQLHAHIKERGLQADVVVGGSLVNMYAKCGSLEDAQSVFDTLSQKNVVTWNTMVAGYVQQGMGPEALYLYSAMQQEGIAAPDSVTFMCLLQACARMGSPALERGKQLHAQIEEQRLHGGVVLGGSLVNMYAKCGSLDDAQRVFDRIPEKNVVAWNNMVAGYAQHGMGKEALHLYSAMQEEGIAAPDSVTFVCLLQACASLGTLALEKGKQLHAQIGERGLEADVVVGGSLVNMYAKCGSLEDAQSVFDRLPEKNMVTWNAMIAGYAKGGNMKDAQSLFDGLGKKDVVTWTALIAGYSQQGMGQEALHLYSVMQEEGIAAPNSVTFVCLLQACASVGTTALKKGRQLHAQIGERGVETDVVVGCSLVNMYAKCGSLEDAQSVFDKLPEKNVMTWNAMIAGYSQQGMGQEALHLYSAMQKEGTAAPDLVTFVCLLQACASMASLHVGKQLHAQIQERGLQADLVVGGNLVNMYAKCGSLEDAQSVFDRLPEKNVVTCNAMIAGYVKCGSMKDAQRLFDGLGKKDVVTWTSMIAGYSQRGMGQEALHLYSAMQEEGITAPNSVTFVCLLQACASVGTTAMEKGKQLHAQIGEQGVEADVVIGCSLVNMYAKCGSLEDAQSVFDKLPEKNVVTWNSMIAGYSQQGMSQEALRLYSAMQKEGIAAPDSVTFVCLLQACASVAALPVGKQIHAQIEERGLETDEVVGSSLVNMYAKCGSMSDAQQVFDALPERVIVAWNALIAGYSRQGDSEVVFGLVHRMREECKQPDDITFLSVLTVCSHVGLVHKGREYFEAMSRNYGMTPSVEHYTCMVDLLGRAGQLDEALEMVRSMPVQPNDVVWHALLGACRKWRNVEVGRHAFDEAVKLNGKDAAAYVMLSNIYTGAQMWEEAHEIQARRKKIGAWKQPGESCWTDQNGRVHSFLVWDKKHPESEGIYARLEQLVPKMKKEGYVPHLDSSLRGTTDAEKEAHLCGHSERLAIAYALNKTPEGTTIRIVKNLRVCDDCHTATAYISKIEKRTIICRDASRFHVYKEGKCSCGDYW